MSRSCFVIMPIKQAGSDEHLEYRALYDTVIGPTLRDSGFETVRADDVTRAGLINADVIQRLAKSDLVVADLTGLNANVFYELGIRHSLRSRGTILFVDSTHTNVPFDLRGYRVIEYVPGLLGYQKLRESLAKYTLDLVEDSENVSRDSPVHDVLPVLPADVFALADGSAEGRLQERISELQSKVQHYITKYGQESAGEDVVTEVVARTLTQARRGELPSDLFRKAHEAARNEDTVSFLDLVNQLVNARSGGVIKVEQWIQLSFDAGTLNLEEVAAALSLRAIEQRPGDSTLKSFYYGRLAHSEDPRQREQARTELRAVVGITFDGDDVVIKRDRRDRLDVAGLMLDAYHRDSLHEEAIKITQALVDLQPGSTLTLRNHARALNELGRRAEAMQFYQRAMEATDVDDTTATWFANDLSLGGKLEAACVLYCRACELDADDAGNFLRLADEICDVRKKRYVAGVVTPESDEVFRIGTVTALVQCAFSCTQLTPEHVDKAQEVCTKSELDESILLSLMSLKQGLHVENDGLSLLSRTDRTVTTHEIRTRLEASPQVEEQLRTALNGE